MHIAIDSEGLNYSKEHFIMEGTRMEELVKLLEGESDSYPTFVRGVSAISRRHPEVVDGMKQYIKENDDADSSDIIERLYDMIEL